MLEIGLRHIAFGGSEIAPESALPYPSRMGTSARCVPIAAASLFCVSCDDSAIDPSRSLVRAQHLPPAELLSRETIEINRGFGDISPGFLSYQLLPDDRLVVTLTDRNYPEDVVIGKETFQLTSEIAAEARRMLWRVRPEKLEGVEWETRPVSCYPQSCHDFGELAVAFIAEGSKPGIDDDRIGIFVLPGPDSCRSPAAIKARRLIQRVMHRFPRSKVAAEFERRRGELFD
jgi:hypothetical protein